jgi:hypothetical protein
MKVIKTNLERIDVTLPMDARCLVTPAIARQWLELYNTGNRHVRQTAVRYLMAKIVSGQWRDDHNMPIQFSTEGILFDGQHRLMAIAATHAVMLPVCFGCSPALKEHTDDGQPRAISDNVRFIEGDQLNKAVSGFVRMRHVIECREAGVRHRGRLTPGECKEIFAAHKDSFTWAASRKVCKLKAIGRQGYWLGFVRYFEIAGRTSADAFVTSFTHTDGDVQQARMLRDYALRTVKENGDEANLEAYYKTAHCCMAHMKGVRVSRVLKGEWLS